MPREKSSGTIPERTSRCSKKPRTGCSRRSARGRRWASCCAATGCRSRPSSEFDDDRDQAGPPDRRGPRPLPDLERNVRPGRPALPAPPRRPVVRLRRGVRHPVQLPRLALRRERPLRRAAVRRHRPSRRALPRQGPHHGLSGRSEGRPAVGLPRSAAGAAAFRTGSRSRGRTASCRSSSPTIPCNWLQCQENSIDPVHFEWMHRNWSDPAATARPARTRPKHLKLAFDEFEYGFTYQRAGRRDADENDPLLDDRPRLPVAERALHRQPLRVARADRRREHAQRRLALHAASRTSASPTCRTTHPVVGRARSRIR